MPRHVPIKYCRHCGRIIPLDAAQCAYCEKMVIREHEQKECPFCRELVKATAVKCRHCGEFLDGRAEKPEQRQQILQIEKAIITTGGGRTVELRRPDGREVNAAELAAAEREKITEGISSPLALPPGGDAEGETGMAGPLVPAEQGEVVPAAPPSLPRVAPEPKEPSGKAPPVEMECHVCHYTVFHGDRHCENCGRDLTLRASERALKPAAQPYELVEYALMLSAAGPAGLVLPAPYSSLIPLAAIALSLWCAGRILRSEGRLKGMKGSLVAALLAVFWLVVIFIAQGA